MSHKLFILCSLVTASSLPAFADEYKGGLGEVYTGIQLTAYAGGCGKGGPDAKYGGGNESSSGLKPQDFTFDKQEHNVTLVAVPQKGGTKELMGCFFKVDAYPEKLFYAGDHYDDGSKSGINSNGKMKMDMSHSCKAHDMNNNTKENATITKLSCPGDKVSGRIDKEKVEQYASSLNRQYKFKQVGTHQSGGTGFYGVLQ